MRTFSPASLLSPLGICLAFACTGAAHSAVLNAYFGTYTGPKSKGIYTATFDTKTGRFGRVFLAAETKNPSFLALHPGGKFLYAVGEVDGFVGKPGGTVSAFRIDRGESRLIAINQQGSGGTGPCHLSIDASGKCVLVANYGGGTVASLPILANGELKPAVSVVQHYGSSINKQRQERPHAHFITPDPGNLRALACDLGIDKVLVYDLDPARATLKPSLNPFAALPPGSGPRHLTFSASGRFVYVLNELLCTVSVLEYNGKTGEMRELQTIATLPEGDKTPNSCAGIDLHPSGKYLYASNRGHDSIAVYSINTRTGILKLVQHQLTLGKTPRHFAVVPGGEWLIAENQNSDSVVVFRIDEKTGTLAPAGHQIEVGSPVCAVFLPEAAE